MKVIWSRRALLDVEHIRDYIAQDSPTYAQPFVERLLYVIRHLPAFPHSGRAMPDTGACPGLRSGVRRYDELAASRGG